MSVKEKIVIWRKPFSTSSFIQFLSGKTLDLNVVYQDHLAESFVILFNVSLFSTQPTATAFQGRFENSYELVNMKVFYMFSSV